MMSIVTFKGARGLFGAILIYLFICSFLYLFEFLFAVVVVVFFSFFYFHYLRLHSRLYWCFRFFIFLFTLECWCLNNLEVLALCTVLFGSRFIFKNIFCFTLFFHIRLSYPLLSNYGNFYFWFLKKINWTKYNGALYVCVYFFHW